MATANGAYGCHSASGAKCVGTVHRLAAGSRTGEDGVPISTKRIARPTLRRVIGFRQCTLLGASPADGTIRRPVIFQRLRLLSMDLYMELLCCTAPIMHAIVG